MAVEARLFDTASLISMPDEAQSPDKSQTGKIVPFPDVRTGEAAPEKAGRGIEWQELGTGDIATAAGLARILSDTLSEDLIQKASDAQAALRASTYGGRQEILESAISTSQRLALQLSDLARALRSPKVVLPIENRYPGDKVKVIALDHLKPSLASLRGKIS